MWMKLFFDWGRWGGAESVKAVAADCAQVMLTQNEAERDGFDASGADADADGSEDAEAVGTVSDEAVK